MAKFVGRGRTRRTNRRIARVRLANPKALPNIKADNRYTPREARRVRKVARQYAKRESSTRQRKPEYNPLAPLTGNRLNQEEKAAEQLQFGDSAEQLARRIRGQEQTTANEAQYYDDWRQALRESAATVKAANEEAVKSQEGRTDQSYQQDMAAEQARNAEDSATAAKLGRGPVHSEEGARAVEAQRQQSNLQIGDMRLRGVSDQKYMELRGVNAAQAKIERLQQRHGQRDDLGREQQKLAKDKGAFKVDFRTKSREAERTYALARKEFGLKRQDMLLRNRATKGQQEIDRQKVAAQKIVAKMYASANRAQARAQVRVAKLQLEKGKISQHQYKTIKNIYEGLPNGGSNGGGGGKPGQGSGPGGKLQTWERDKVDLAVRQFGGGNLGPHDQQRAIDAAVKHGIPARLARIAWRRYAKKFKHAPVAQAPGANGESRPG